MIEAPTKSYGEGRTRSGVSYAEIERAAIAILRAERRPTVETVREALGTGSPDTIASALKRFWRDLGARIEGDPAALTRLPPDIADLADGMWQRALKLAGEAAKLDDNAARERLNQIKLENEIRAHSLTLREKEWDVAARERERALADARAHLLLLSKALGHEQATVKACTTRIADLEMQIAQYRDQLTALVAAATRPRPARPQPAKVPKRASPAPRRPHATPPSGKRAKLKRTRAATKALARGRKPLPKSRRGQHR